MKRKVKITFEMDIDYPDISKETKKLSKDFDNWLIEWALSPDMHPLPVLFQVRKNGSIECLPHSITSIKITRDKQIILDTTVEECCEAIED